MEDRLRRRISEMATQLALEEKEKLGAAETFVDLERLAVEIGDELTRQLTGSVLSSRAEEATKCAVHECPTCGKACAVEDAEPLILKGMRGDIEYCEPKYHCSRCRRDFFPGGEGTSAAAS